MDLTSVDCIEEAFKFTAIKNVVMPPIMSFHIPEHNGEVDVKTAYVPGIDSFAVKMSPGFFDNPKLGLPSLNGIMVLFASQTGLVEAVLLDNGYLTNLRTAVAGAVAARWCSREDSISAAMIGTGLQARMQLQALTLVRDINKAFIWGRDFAKAQECAAECAQELGIEVVARETVKEACADADIVVTTTPSQEPLVSLDDLKPGQHVTAMGSDADYKAELAPELVASVDRYICDNLAQCQKQGELRLAIEKNLISLDDEFIELGQVIAGQAVARKTVDEITVCDLTGMGVQDTAIATLAMNECIKNKG